MASDATAIMPSTGNDDAANTSLDAAVGSGDSSAR
jgi:hypothetical protein